MNIVEIGQQGKLGKEILTVVSFNEKTFTCEGGRTFLLNNAKWMTEGKDVKVKAPKKNKSYFFNNEKCEKDLNEKLNVNEFDVFLQNSVKKQLPSSLR